jgi:hypothetical protein
MVKENISPNLDRIIDTQPIIDLIDNININRSDDNESTGPATTIDTRGIVGLIDNINIKGEAESENIDSSSIVDLLYNIKAKEQGDLPDIIPEMDEDKGVEETINTSEIVGLIDDINIKAEEKVESREAIDGLIDVIYGIVEEPPKEDG